MHYSSSRCHRVTRSVAAAEEHAPIHAVDVRILVRDLLNEPLRRTAEKKAHVDSRYPFNDVTKNSNTADRPLQINIFAIRESYQKRELKRTG